MRKRPGGRKSPARSTAGPKAPAKAEPGLVSLALGSFCQFAGQVGVQLADEQIGQFERYLETLLLWNRRMALVSQADPLEIACKHFADSIVAASLCAAAERVADLGSGAGFPGLPIAIARPAAKVTLVESNRKKASFLGEAVRAAGLAHVRVVEERIERVSVLDDHRAHYSVVTARALATVRDILQLARPLLARGGRAISMKGPSYNEETRSLDPPRLGYKRLDTIRYQLPDGSRRVLLVFERL